MVKVRTRPETGRIYFDGYYRGKRFKELTLLKASAQNLAAALALAQKMNAEIESGSFDFSRYFPNSKKADQFLCPTNASSQPHLVFVKGGARPKTSGNAPNFESFAAQHYNEQGVGWRASTRDWMQSILKTHLLPAFATRPIDAIRREDILAFRLQLSERQTSKGRTALSPKSINTILRVLKSILSEAAHRYDFPNPMAGFKRLKVQRKEIIPFTMDEVQRMVKSVRPDYRDFLIVGFFTGLRPAEQIGLRWENVDFEKREIRIRETFSKGRREYTKTDGSQREIAMSAPVYEALRSQQAATSKRSEYVFCLRDGQPVDAKSFSMWVWQPLIRHLGIKRRTPYQMRHTCATMWLGAGENPEWIAKQLGHTTTEMLFRVYSRYVPNLTRKDGSAFDRMISAAMSPPLDQSPDADAGDQA